MAENENESYLFALLVVAAEWWIAELESDWDVNEGEEEREIRGALSLVMVSQEDAAADEVMLSSSKRGKERGKRERGEGAQTE